MSRYSNINRIIHEISPRRILEVGTWNGINARKMVQAAQKHNGDIYYLGFDLFEQMNPQIKKNELHTKRNVEMWEAKTNLLSTGAKFDLVQGNTRDTLWEYIHDYDGKPFDFILIDGGHSVDTIRNDWNAIEKLIQKGVYTNSKPVILFDDYYDVDYIGCRAIIQSLDKRLYDARVLPPMDYDKVSGFNINMVEVIPRYRLN